MAAEHPVPVLALDVGSRAEALALARRVTRAAWVKVGLQLFVAEGPAVVAALRDEGREVFLDLKLHDIPNTVSRAVESAAELGVGMLTVHASGGRGMLRAAAGARGPDGPALLAVTVLTSLDGPGLAEAWGRDAASPGDEAVRLASFAADTGIQGVVCSAHEARRIREGASPDLRLLTPGIRLPGDAAHDQARVATPAEAARAGADFIVVGRTVTAASDPAAAFDRVLDDLGAGVAR